MADLLVNRGSADTLPERYKDMGDSSVAKVQFTPGMYASDAIAITPSDSTVVDFYGIYVGGAGDVTVKGAGGVAVTFKAPPVGTILPIRVNRVMATTTATLLLGLKL